MAQSLRQAILYSDAICIGSDEQINEKFHLKNDYQTEHAYQTKYTFTQTIYSKTSKITIPTPLIIPNIQEPFITKKNCMEMGYAYPVNTKLNDIYFLKFENKKWQVVYTAIITEDDLKILEQVIDTFKDIEKQQNKQIKYSRYVDWILSPDANLMEFGQALRELDSGSTFMQYYAPFNTLNATQKKALANIILKDLQLDNGYSNYFEKSLLYLVFPEYKDTMKSALVHRLLYEYEHLEDEESPTYTYYLEETVKAIYMHDDSEPLLNEIRDVIAQSQYEYIDSSVLVEKVKLFLQYKGLIKSE